MKYCTVCQKELVRDDDGRFLNEHGPVNVPLCYHCFLDYSQTIDILLADYIEYWQMPIIVNYCNKWQIDFGELIDDLESYEIDIDWILQGNDPKEYVTEPEYT